MIILVLILFGLVLGSFVNALVWRLHEERDFVRERSECPHCHHVLAPKDLVPVASWLWLKGKCRYCHKRIPDTPLAELLVPVVFVLSYVYWPQPFVGVGLYTFVLWLVFVVGFAALALYDFKWFILPDKIVFPLMALTALQVLGAWVCFGQSWHVPVDAAIGALLMSGIFYGIYLISGGKWIGYGDVKLALVLGALAGGALPALLVLLVASVVGLVVALPLLLTGRATAKSHLPFGPLLLTGTLVVVLWGTSIINAYTRLFTP
ncbi:MAG TPA: prepilin peptidase [Patescibacteria group bacterium]|nr:prepilin peptidase [Patescibacteria group bacterium]